jgi:RNA polymerase sigma-70 factor (ECF subfamily)
MPLDPDAFDRDRPRLFAIAYRMVGVAADAEELVQETWVRVHERGVDPDDPGAYATRVLTRLCIDHMRSARVRRESYVGPWLPEPVRTGAPDDPERHAMLAESAQMAFLVMLEELGPLERAVFLLREVFDYDYASISELVDRRADACRQIARRARGKVQGKRPDAPTSPDDHAELMGSFFAAAMSGDLGAIESLLTEDAALWSDGGGVAGAALRPIHGAPKLARFFAARARASGHLRPEPGALNGMPALLLWDGDRLDSATLFEVREGAIARVYIVRHPDKLARL